MKYAFAVLSVLALAATPAVADDAMSEVSLPELPSAPVLQPAKPAASAKKAVPAKKSAPGKKPAPAKPAPAKPAQAKPKAAALRTPSASAEIDLSASKVLSAETEDGKPVYVVFQKDGSESYLFADNEGGGWIGNTYLKVGGGSLNRVGTKLAKPHGASGSYAEVDASLSLTSLLSVRFVGMTLLNAEASGGYEAEHAYVRVEGSEFSYSSLHPMLVVSANRDGILNPYAGVGVVFQSATVSDCKCFSWDSWSEGAPPFKSGDLDGDGCFFSPTVGLEVNIRRFHFSGECLFSIGADKCQTNPFDTSKESCDILYGGRVTIGVSATDNLMVFANTTMTQAYHIFGAGLGWRF